MTTDQMREQVRGALGGWVWGHKPVIESVREVDGEIVAVVFVRVPITPDPAPQQPSSTPYPPPAV